MEKLPSRRELTMTPGEANLRALVFIIPVLLFMGIPYYFLWMRDLDSDTFILFLRDNLYPGRYFILWIFVALAAGIVFHELIHGLVFLLFCKKGKASIEFGVMWQYMAPYCHCKEPLPVRSYILGALMPAIVLGFGPAVTGLITGKLFILLYGMLFTLAAGGDFLIVWLLRRQPKDTFVLDHESKVGCYIIDKKDDSGI